MITSLFLHENCLILHRGAYVTSMEYWPGNWVEIKDTVVKLRSDKLTKLLLHTGKITAGVSLFAIQTYARETAV